MNGMDIQTLLNETQGLCVEVAGPTPEGYKFQQFFTLPKQPLVTNIANPITLYPFGDNPLTLPVDQLADIRAFPFKDESIGILLVNSLPKTYDEGKDLRAVFWQTAYSVLSKNGVAIFELAVEKDKQQAKEYGFELLDDTRLPETIFAIKHSL